MYKNPYNKLVKAGLLDKRTAIKLKRFERNGCEVKLVDGKCIVTYCK